jgi:hypothetical protein
MKHIANIITAIACLIITASVIACNNEKKPKEETKNETLATKGNDTLIYSYRDASVPPQYHRSYTIRVIPGQVYLSIDVYGKIILEDSLVLTRATYDSFATAINDLHIKKIKEVPGEGCTGGTSDKLDLYAGSSKEVKGSIYYCGGKKYGDLEGDVAAAAGLFKALIPDLDKKIDASRKNE